VCDVSVNTLTLEVTGKEEKMLALKEVLEPYGGWVGGAAAQTDRLAALSSTAGAPGGIANLYPCRPCRLQASWRWPAPAVW
jgi:hypothetical protein